MYQLFAGANESVSGNTLVPVVPAESSDLLWEKVLSRYMGQKGMTEFLANHGDSSSEECSTAA